MKHADKIDDVLLGKRRKKIETIFSSLEKLGIQDFRSRSLLGFESRLESLLLVYCLMLNKARERFGNTLKFSIIGKGFIQRIATYHQSKKKIDTN